MSETKIHERASTQVETQSETFDHTPFAQIRALVARYGILPSGAVKRAHEFVMAATGGIEGYRRVAPLTAEKRKYFHRLVATYQKYNIRPSAATREEHEFILDVTVREFFDEQPQNSDNCRKTDTDLDADVNSDSDDDLSSPDEAEVHARRLDELRSRMEEVGRKAELRDTLGCFEKMEALFCEFGIHTEDESIRMCKGMKGIIDEAVEEGMKLRMGLQELAAKMKALGRAKEFLDALDDDGKMDALLLEFGIEETADDRQKEKNQTLD